MTLSHIIKLGVHMDRYSLLEFIRGEDLARRAAMVRGDLATAVERLRERDRLIEIWKGI